MKKRATRFLTLGLMTLAATLGAEDAKVKEVSMTVYNGNYAVIREVRDLEVKEGEQWVQIRGVPSTIERTSVSLETPGKPGAIRVLEQNYLYDLVSRSKLLEKYIDRDIVLENNGQRSEVELLSSGGGLIVRNKGEIHLSPKGNIILPELPGGLLTRPTLKWKVDSDAEGKVPTQIRYMARGLSWSADYNLVMSKDGSKMDLSSWISLTNSSGGNFDNAKIKLMAGDVNRARNYPTGGARRENLGTYTKSKGVTSKAFSEYHMYELPGRTSLVASQLKQVEFLNRTGLISTKKYRYNQGSSKVQAYLTFKNDEKSGLGIALPAGKIRMFQKDEDDGQLEFVGEDRIDHTPKKEERELLIGNSFDLVGETKLVKQTNGWNSRTQSWEVTVKNRKEEDSVTIEVLLPISTNYKILEKSFDSMERMHASQVKVKVTLKPDEVKTLKYKVFWSW